MEPPPLALQYLLPKAIAVTSRVSGMVTGTIGLDGEHHAPGFIGMRTGKVNAIAGDAVLGRNRNVASLKSILDGKLKRVERDFQYVRT